MLDIRKLSARGSNLMRYQVCITTDPVPTTAFQPYQLRRLAGWMGVIWISGNTTHESSTTLAPGEWWPYMGWEWAIFDIRKHRFATFQDVYCHIMPEWCWTTIQETPVSLLSAFETREPGAFGAGPSVPGVGARPSAPPLDPRLKTAGASKNIFNILYLIYRSKCSL